MARQRQRQSEWLTAVNPDVLLALRSPQTPGPQSTDTVRRLQLFNCACARMVWDLLPTDARSAVTIRERFADGRATEADVRASAIRVTQWVAITFQQHAIDAARGDPRSAAKALATRAAGPAPPGGNPVAKEWQVAWNRAFAEAREYQAELVRDIFPPPRYAPWLEPEWQTSTVVAIAQQMDDTGDFSAVPILADALQDAGCYDAVMLDRCRAKSGIHSRGNWVVDLVLGREVDLVLGRE